MTMVSTECKMIYDLKSVTKRWAYSLARSQNQYPFKFHACPAEATGTANFASADRGGFSSHTAWLLNNISTLLVSWAKSSVRIYIHPF